MQTFTESELYNACKVLFGTSIRADRRFLEYIQASGLKSAFRKKAMDTHPDRFATMDEEYQKTCAVQFREVTEAYDKLNNYIKLRDRGGVRFKEPTLNTSYANEREYANYSNTNAWKSSNDNSQSSTFSNPDNNNTDNSYSKDYAKYYNKDFSSNEFDSKRSYSSTESFKRTNNGNNGEPKQSFKDRVKETFTNTFRRSSSSKDDKTKTANNYSVSSEDASSFSSSYKNKSIPSRKLKIGEYLYYSGVIAWKELIAALVWQAKNRDRMGEIASRWGWINEKQIKTVLKRKDKGERLGDALVRMKVITPFQRNMLVWQQRKSQKPIGEYFMKENKMPEIILKRYLKNLNDHNMHFCA
ncbi:molecular chaperone DnaJ [Candidatus Magnetoovum chiemensis]|nr:molecular chaperone DnaJ [Candidatus Magnetoovum chiemensis]